MNRKGKSITQRILALMLSTIMLSGILPITAMAGDGDAQVSAQSTEQYAWLDLNGGNYSDDDSTTIKIT